MPRAKDPKQQDFDAKSSTRFTLTGDDQTRDAGPILFYFRFAAYLLIYLQQPADYFRLPSPTCTCHSIQPFI